MILTMRRQTRLLCSVVSMCLLFAQLAVAAYACPKDAMPSSAPVAVVESDSAQMAHECEVLDSENPNLCLQHFQGGNQLPDGSGNPHPLQSAAVSLEIALPEPAGSLTPLSAAAADMLLRDGSPPLTIRNCCFRI